MFGIDLDILKKQLVNKFVDLTIFCVGLLTQILITSFLVLRELVSGCWLHYSDSTAIINLPLIG